MRSLDQLSTEDEKRTEFVRLCSVRDYPRVYVLGSYARYVTIYAQQVRALNLIDALVKDGILGEGSSLAVIGGGIAGVTAAAAAALRGVAKIRIFEKEPNLMRIQRKCEKRYVHPHIYDWPTDVELKGNAGLPVMNWSAGIAADVVDQLDKEWEAFRSKYGGVIAEPELECGNLSVRNDRPHPWIQSEKWTKPARDNEFDAIILAVGFGVDAASDTDDYWTDTRIDSHPPEAVEAKWLVSGTGDGGLTDLMRLCILDMRQGTLIDAVKDIGLEIGKRLQAEEAKLRNEASKGGSGTDLGVRYAALYEAEAQKLPASLGKTLKPTKLGKVWLNAQRETAYRPSSSVLNRLIVAFLRREGRFQFLEGAGHIQKTIPNKGEIEVRFKSGKSLRVSTLIRRHGPDRALERSFPEIWAKCERVRREWQSSNQHDDWTKKPLWSSLDYSEDRAVGTGLPRIDFSHRLRCLMITPGPNESDHVQLQQGLDIFYLRAGARYFGSQPLQSEPIDLAVDKIFSSPSAYERAIRALCDAPIVVFDLTGFDAGVMLLLGIRSSVRRGVTLTVTSGSVTDSGLPFNIISLNPTPYNLWDIADALEAGFNALQKQPDQYLDLPAYDAVRRLGEDHRPVEPTEQILLLGWFDPDYIKASASVVQHPIRLAYNVLKRDDKRIVTTLDSRSPQLVPQRLYAAIRRTRLCIIDWTGWRPNVFFEIGVRLAVNAADPLSVFTRSEPPGWTEASPGMGSTPRVPWPVESASVKLLRDFFRPAEFTWPTGYAEISDRVARFQNEGVCSSREGPISPGRTYRVICECIQWHNERGGTPVYDLLSREASDIAGPPSPEEGRGVPVLFGELHATHARMASLEFLFAGWFYLQGRYDIKARLASASTAFEDPILTALERIGAEIVGRSLNTRDPDQKKLAGEIARELSQVRAKRLGTADVIDQARRLRAEALKARDSKDWNKVFDNLEGAISLLENALNELRRVRQMGLDARRSVGAGVYEKEIVRLLIHTHGSKGGAFRDRTKYVAAIKAYDSGHTLEKDANEDYRILNSYNLTQRLITRVFAKPPCLLPDAARVAGLHVPTELNLASTEIAAQLGQGRGDDEYALADYAWVWTLLGSKGWEDRWFDFLDSSPEPYAFDANIPLLRNLAERIAASGNTDLSSIAERLEDARKLLV